MRRILRLKPSPAMVVALTALVVALGGTAYAVTLPANSVGPAQLRAGAVRTGKLAARAVTTSRLAGRAVTTGKLATGAVTQGKLADGAVTFSRLAPGAVGTKKIQDRSVTGSKLANGTVGGTQLASGAVTNSKLGSSSVTGSKIAARAVGADDLNVITLREASVSIAASGTAGDGSYPTRSVTRACASNERAISAGSRWDTSDNDDELPVIALRYLVNGSGQPTGVEGRGGNDTANAREFFVQVLCLRT
jgi:hypothetical protein